MSLLDKFSKGQIIFIVILLGVVLIYFLNPPHTSCEAQKEVLREHQEKFLNWFKEEEESVQKFKRRPQWKGLFEICQSTNTIGGCYEFFSKIRILMKDLEHIPKKCLSKIISEQKITNALWSTAKLMVSLTWETQMEDDSYDKKGWFDESDTYLFCTIKRRLKNYFPTSWKNFQKSLLKKLSDKKNNLEEKEVFHLSLFSLPCGRK